jgi:hypothetical protein
MVPLQAYRLGFTRSPFAWQSVGCGRGGEQRDPMGGAWKRLGGNVERTVIGSGVELLTREPCATLRSVGGIYVRYARHRGGRAECRCDAT